MDDKSIPILASMLVFLSLIKSLLIQKSISKSLLLITACIRQIYRTTAKSGSQISSFPPCIHSFNQNVKSHCLLQKLFQVQANNLSSQKLKCFRFIATSCGDRKTTSGNKESAVKWFPLTLIDVLLER